MDIIRTPADIITLSKRLHQEGKRIGLVPTMGNLHAGHLSLVEAIQPKVDCVIVSIFVNPAQFGPNEDLDSYPRTFDEDCQKLKALGVDYVFAPNTQDIYPADVANHTLVKVPGLSDILCGVTRPIFFQGITTIVCKLFNLIHPDVAIFGEKDYQQLLCIQRMVKDLNLNIDIISGPIVREKNGLAMSSRNQYLSDAQKTQAGMLQASLQFIIQQANSLKDLDSLIGQTKNILKASGFEPDYIEVRKRSDLNTPDSTDKELIILAAAMLGGARLIDNIPFDMK